MDDLPVIQELKAQYLKEKEREGELKIITKENWEHHREIRIDALRSLDHLIFAVSTGAIGVSIASIGYSSNDILFWQALCLIFSWGFLFLSIISSAAAHILNAHSSTLNLARLELFVSSGFTKPSPDWNMNTEEDPEIKTTSTFCAFSRVFAMIFLVLGSLCLFIFGASLIL